MRHSRLTLLATVLFGFGMVQVHLVGQSDPLGGTISRHIRVDFGARDFGAGSGKGHTGPRLEFPNNDFIDPSESRPAFDCAMPVITGDPLIDPLIVKSLPPDAAMHSMRIIKVPRCQSVSPDGSARDGSKR